MRKSNGKTLFRNETEGIMKTKRFGEMSLKKGDFLIFSLIIVIVIASAIGFYRAPLSAHTVTIYVDSQKYASYVISEGTEKTVTVQTDSGYNQVKLQSNGVQMIESNCSNHDCIRMGTISHAGDMIICLPNKVMVVLEGGDFVDAVSY